MNQKPTSTQHGSIMTSYEEIPFGYLSQLYQRYINVYPIAESLPKETIRTPLSPLQISLFLLTQHRVNKPANISTSGEVEWFLHGELGRHPKFGEELSEPTNITVEGVKEWRMRGVLHNENYPARVLNGAWEEWYQENELHRVDEPAVTNWAEKREEWWKNGGRHRVDHPAVVNHGGDGGEQWWYNGMLHRWDGPALIGSCEKPAIKVYCTDECCGEVLTFYPKWSVFGIPTRFPDVCETVITIAKQGGVGELLQFLNHEDYVVVMLAHHHLPDHVKPSFPFYDDEKFFRHFRTEDELLGKMSTIIQLERNSTAYTVLLYGRSLIYEHVNVPVQITELPPTPSSHFPDGGAVHFGGGKFLGEESGVWWHKEGILHREGAPAVIVNNGGEYWYKEGKLHREDGPAAKWAGVELWYVNGKLHRETGPAVRRGHDLDEEWWRFGVLHRENHPAVITAEGREEWWWEGKRHRLDGAAIFQPFVSNGKVEEYWVNDHPTTEKKLCQKVCRKVLDKDELKKLTHHSDYTLRCLATYALHQRGTIGGNEIDRVLHSDNDKTYQEEKVAVIHHREDSHTWMWNIHNETGSAVKYLNGDEEWWQNGELCRESNKPTIVRADGTMEWWKGRYAESEHPKLHRQDGPAIIYPKGIEKEPHHRYVWWWEGETTEKSELCEIATSTETPPETLSQLCLSGDYVVRNLAVRNPNCAEDDQILYALTRSEEFLT